MALPRHDTEGSEALAEKLRELHISRSSSRRAPSSTSFHDDEENDEDLEAVDRFFSWFAMCQHPKAA